MTDVVVPNPGSVLGERQAAELLASIVSSAKDKLTEVERESPEVGAVLVTDTDHAAFVAGIHAGALAAWCQLYVAGLIKVPDGEQP